MTACDFLHVVLRRGERLQPGRLAPTYRLAMESGTDAPYDHFWTAGQDSARRMAIEMWEKSVPRLLAVLGISFGVAILYLGLTANGPTTVTGLVVMVIVIACLIPVLRILAVRRFTNICQQWASPGMTIAARFDPDRMAIKTVLSESVTTYSVYDKIVVRSRAVFLKRAGQRLYSMFPVEVVPAEAQATIRAGMRGVKA